jgi:cytochrome c-type biogenesis protein CcmH
MPVVGLGCYSALGSPGLPSEPLSAREAGPGGDPELAKLIGKAERHLRADPDDGRGWDVLAPIYFRTGRLEDARVAYGNAIRLLGPSARRESGLGEVLVVTNAGQVTDAARAAFQNALKLEPNDPKASFYLALGLAQDGRTKQAIAAFNDLANRAPPNAPWLPAVQAQVAALEGPADNSASNAPRMAAGGAAAVPPGNPTPEQMAAAENMSAGDRVAMIRGMVSQLDTRLSAEPDNFPGWMRLVRSYMVLNEPAKAKGALGRALKAFPADTDHGKALMALASKLGISTAEATP